MIWNKLLLSFVLVLGLNLPVFSQIEDHLVPAIRINSTWGVTGFAIDPKLDGRIFVLRVFPNTPASKAGLEVGDEILSVDNIKLRTSKPQQVLLLVHGTEMPAVGSAMSFVVQHKGVYRSLTLERVDIRSIEEVPKFIKDYGDDQILLLLVV